MREEGREGEKERKRDYIVDKTLIFNLNFSMSRGLDFICKSMAI